MSGVKRQYLGLLLILLLGGFLRFYRLPYMADFTHDQEYAANFAYAVIKEYPIQLIGQGLSVKGLFMGPLYFYYLVPFYLVAGLHPIGGAVGSVVLGLFTIAAYYYCLKNVFGARAGLVGAFLRAVLISKIGAEWAVTPAFSADLVALLTWYCLYKYWKGETKYFVEVGFLFGLYTSFHPILFPFYVVFVALLLIKRTFPNIKTWILGGVAFLVPILPLVIFEYLHDFWEIRQLFGGTNMGSEVLNLVKLQNLIEIGLKDTQFTFAYDVFGGIPLAAILMILGLMVLVVLRIGFWKEQFHQIILPITLFAFIGYYFVLPFHASEYYFLGFTTLVLIYLAAAVSLMKNRFLWPGLVLIAVFNLNLVNKKWNNPSLSTLYHKDAVVKQILEHQPEGEEFFVSYISQPGWKNGFEYLFKLYGRIPQAHEAREPIYTIVTPKGLINDRFQFESGNIRLIMANQP